MAMQPALPGAKPHISPTTLSSSELWGRAMEQVRGTDDWKLFCKLIPTTTAVHTPEDIALIVADSRDKAEKLKNGRTDLVQNVCTQIFSIMTKVKDLGAAAAALNPYASVAWSGVQFLLAAALADHEAKQLCWENLPRITYLISRYQTFEEVYSLEHTKAMTSVRLLEDALVKLYILLLRYQMAIIIYCGSRWQRFKTAFNGVAAGAVQQTLAEIRSQESEIAETRIIIDREATNSSFQKLYDGFEELKSTMMSLESILAISTRALVELSSIVEDTERERILNWISQFKYENSHNKVEKTAMVGTGSWLLENAEFITWRKARMPGTLWLRGFMGSGKSCLTHLVIETIKASSDPANGERLMFFYCDGTDSDSVAQMSQASNILRSFVKQLAIDNTERKLMNCVEKAWKENHLKSDLTLQQSLDLISEISTNCMETIIVVDGLDECQDHVQQELTSALHQLLQRSKTTMKLLIAARPEVEYNLRDLDVATINIRDNNVADINFLIEETVRKSAVSGALRHLYTKNAESQAQNVIDTLKKYAQGMFRWVQLSFKYLHASKHYSTMNRRLEQLSRLKDLFDLYDVIWQNMQGELDTEDQIAVRTLLSFVLYGKGYPEVRILMDMNRDPIDFGLSYIEQAAAFASFGHVDMTINVDEIVHICSSFVDLTSVAEQPSLRLQHFSVREYLIERHPTEFSTIKGHAFLARICMDWYNHCLSKLPINYYISSRWPDHLMEVRGELETLCKEDARFCSSIHTFLLDSWASEGFCRWSQEWKDAWDVMSVGSKWAGNLLSSPPSSLFARILLDIGLSQEGCTIPDAVEISGKNISLPAMNALHFAAAIGNLKAVNFLLRNRLDVNAEDKYGRNALFYALKDNYGSAKLEPIDQDIIKRLLESGISVNSEDHDGNTPLHAAVKKGNEDIVRLLLESGAMLNVKGRYGDTPLCLAVDGSFLPLVELLIEYDADPSAKDDYCLTPLERLR
jgi:hypothetical protein